MHNQCIFMHDYSSKTVKNTSGCQKNAKNPAFWLENAGKNKKIFKKIKKYSKRG